MKVKTIKNVKVKTATNAKTKPVTREMAADEFARYIINKVPDNQEEPVDIEFYGSYDENEDEYIWAFKLRITSFADSLIVLCNYYGGGSFFAHELNVGQSNWAADFIESFSTYLCNVCCEEVYVEIPTEAGGRL